MVKRLIVPLSVCATGVVCSRVPKDLIDRLVAEQPDEATDEIASHYIDAMNKITERDNSNMRDMCTILLHGFSKDLCYAWNMFDDDILMLHVQLSSDPSYLKEVLPAFDECQTRTHNERLDYPAELLWLGLAFNKTLADRIHNVRRHRLATTEDENLRRLFENHLN